VAHAGHVVWSTYDPASGSYYLTLYREGKTSRLPVPPRRVPFDVDLGPVVAARLFATYSRCKQESRQLDGAGTLPDYTLGRGCDLYAFDLHGFRERKLRNASSKHASEYLPTVSTHEPVASTTVVAFGRTYDERRGRRHGYRRDRLPYLYVQGLGSDGRPRRLAGGPRGRYGGPGPSRLDLHRQRLALEWTYFADRPSLGGPARLFQIRLVSTTRRTVRVVDEGGYTGGTLSANFLISPVIGGSDIHWLLRNDGESGDFGFVFRHVMSTRKCLKSRERLEPGSISLALDSGSAFYVQPAPGGYQVRQTPWPTGFEPASCGPAPRS
jgi:hypothetical protein